MTESVSPSVAQATLAIRRAQLEMKVAEAISRAQKQYIQVNTTPEAPRPAGPAHLGKLIDIRA